MKDVTIIELTEVCPKAGFDNSMVEPSGSAKSEVVRFFRQMHHRSYSCSLVFKAMTIWGGIKECTDIWHDDVRSRPQEVNEQSDIWIMYNKLETIITFYFSVLYQNFWPDSKSPWGDSCRAPVRIAPHRSPSEGCPNTCDRFAPAHNTIQYNTLEYRASVTGWHGHYTKQTYLSKCLDIFRGNEHAWIHILQVPLEGLTVQPFPQIVTFSQVPDVPLLIGNTIFEC